MQGLISVVIVNWNTVDYLRQCLTSMLSRKHEHPLEIIVVDNGSSDGSPEAVRREFPEVILIQNGCNLGFAKANNIGIRRATGRYICLINSDVVVHEGCLDRLCSYMDQNPSIGVLGPRVFNSDLTLQPSCRQFPTLWNSACRALALDTVFPRWPLFGGYLMTFWQHDTPKSVDALSGCFWMVRKETFDSVGLLDESFYIYGEDIDFCKRCQIKGSEIVYYPDATAVHFGGASSSRLPVKFEVENLKATLHYWGKHHSRPAQAAYTLIRMFTHLRRMLHGLVFCSIRPSKREDLLVELKANSACLRWLFRPSKPPVAGNLMGVSS